MSTPPVERLRWYLPTGRRNRSDWWIGYLLVFALLGMVAVALDGWLAPDAMALRHPDGGLDLFWFLPQRAGIVTGIAGLLLTPPYVGATVTRLHDRDHSAWWLLWLLLGPVGALVLLVTCGLLGTRPGANRYGPPPRVLGVAVPTGQGG